MKHILLILFCFAFNTLLAQDSTYFKKDYDIHLNFFISIDMLIESDTIYALGIFKDTSVSDYSSFVLLQIDSSGNLVNQFIIGEEGVELTYTQEMRLTLSPNRDIVFASLSLQTDSLYVFQFNLDTKEYVSHPIDLGYYYYGINEIFILDNKYYLHGSGYPDSVELFRNLTACLDENFEIIYASVDSLNEDLHIYAGDVDLDSDSSKFIKSGYSYNLPINGQDQNYYKYIMNVDLNGQVIDYHFDFTDSASFRSIKSFIKLTDGYLLYTSQPYDLDASIPDNIYLYNFTPGFIRYDENYNEIWKMTIANNISNTPCLYIYCYYSELIQAQDGTFIGIGQSKDAESYKLFMGAVSVQGDSLWMRLDTFMFNDTITYRCEFISADLLSSGSIVIFGYGSPFIAQRRPLLAKTDARGCYSPGCHPYNLVKSADPYLFECKVSPNPASDYLQVTAPVTTFEYSIRNINGAIIRPFQTIQNEEAIPIFDLASGTYLLYIRKGQYFDVVKFIKRG